MLNLEMFGLEIEKLKENNFNFSIHSLILVVLGCKKYLIH